MRVVDDSGMEYLSEIALLGGAEARSNGMTLATGVPILAWFRFSRHACCRWSPATFHTSRDRAATYLTRFRSNATGAGSNPKRLRFMLGTPEPTTRTYKAAKIAVNPFTSTTLNSAPMFPKDGKRIPLGIATIRKIG